MAVVQQVIKAREEEDRKKCEADATESRKLAKWREAYEKGTPINSSDSADE